MAVRRPRRNPTARKAKQAARVAAHKALQKKLLTSAVAKVQKAIQICKAKGIAIPKAIMRRFDELKARLKSLG